MMQKPKELESFKTSAMTKNIVWVYKTCREMILLGHRISDCTHSQVYEIICHYHIKRFSWQLMLKM